MRIRVRVVCWLRGRRVPAPETALTMLTEEDKDHIRRSWKLVVPIAETAADLFYRRLFELKPEYRPLFPENMAGQKSKLLRMLAFIVKSLDYPETAWRDEVSETEDLLLILLALGRRHHSLYSVPREAYGSVGEALLWTLNYGLGEAFTPEVKHAWTEVYKAISTTMLMSSMAVDAEQSLERAFGAGQADIETRLEAIGMSEIKAPSDKSGEARVSKGAVR